MAKAFKVIIYHPSQEKVPAAEAKSESESAEGDNKLGTFQQEGETGPTNLSVAREAAQV